MTTFIWSISQMDRLTSDGFVVTAHYRVDASDEAFSASTYGTVGFVEQPGQSLTPYEALTQEQVVGWVQDALGKDVVEGSLQSQLDALANPVQEAGLPWA